jgi:iron complex outermembrane receptor protein
MTRNFEIRRRSLATTAIGLALASAAGAPAFAQTADKAAEVEEVIVTATGTSIRGVEAVGSETVLIGRDAIVASGLPTPIEVLRTLPQVQGLGFDNVPHTAQNGNGNLQRGTSISLRGLQSNATLVLIDGHRIAPTGNVFSFTEANQLPVSVIERIDVVADGASAIYGSDAVAGVVNFIPRKTFEGVEVSARYRHTKYFDQPGGAILAGHSWDKLFGLGGGHIVVAGDYDQQSPMLRGETPYLRQDLRPFGGNDGRITNNTATSLAPGNLIVAGPRNTTLPSAGNFTYYGIPTSGPVNASTLRLNQPNLFDTSDFVDFMPRTRRYQAFLYVDQELSDDVTVYYEGYYNRRKSELRSAALSGLRTIPASSPFYITGVPGVAPGAPETVSFSFINSIGNSVAHIQDDSLANTVGLRYSLPKAWTAEVSFTNSFDRLCANCIDPLNNNINAAVLQAELNNGNINPFSGAPIAEAELRKFLPAGYDQSRSVLDDTQAHFDGPIFSLPGGEVRMAVGGEHQHITAHRTSRGIQATSDTIGAEASRKVNSFYGELFVPIIGGETALPFMKRLVIDLALRTDDYSDFGRTTNPKAGATWRSTTTCSSAGPGASRSAPEPDREQPGVLLARGDRHHRQRRRRPGAAGDQCRDRPVQRRGGFRLQRRPLAGEGAQLLVRAALPAGVPARSRRPGDLLQHQIYQPDHRPADRLGGLPGDAAEPALYSAYITPAVQPAGCINGQPATYNPAYQAALSRPTLTPIDQSNFCSSVAIIYRRGRPVHILTY